MLVEGGRKLNPVLALLFRVMFCSGSTALSLLLLTVLTGDPFDAGVTDGEGNGELLADTDMDGLRPGSRLLEDGTATDETLRWNGPLSCE